MAGEGGPPGRGVPDLPVPDGLRGDAAGMQVAGCPGAVELAGVEGQCISQDTADVLVWPRWRAGGGLAGQDARLRAGGLVLARAGRRGLRGGGGGKAWGGVVAVQDANGVGGNAGGCCGDAVTSGQDGGGGLGARVGRRPSWPGRTGRRRG